MAYYSTKTYGHNIGLSAVFRQPHADHSHCRFLHGYSLQFKFVFGTEHLDHRNWDEDTFDHQTVIDINDPMKDDLLLLETKGLAQITQLDGVGAEKFAEHAWRFADNLVREATDNRCYCVSAECAEHGSNSAIYEA